MKNKSAASLKTVAFLMIFFSAISSLSYANEIRNEEEQESTLLDESTQSDIFAQMEEMQKQMDKTFAEQRKLMDEMIAQSRKNFDKIKTSSNKTSLISKQDKDFYIYELRFSSFKKEEIEISMKDRLLSINAEHKKEKEDKKKDQVEKIISSDNFFYSAIIPQDADLKPEILREEGKITIKFRKISQ